MTQNWCQHGWLLHHVYDLIKCFSSINCPYDLQLNERLGQFIAMVEYDRLLAPDARVARCIAQLYNPLLYPGLGATRTGWLPEPSVWRASYS
jgi:hypothetical protein